MKWLLSLLLLVLSGMAPAFGQEPVTEESVRRLLSEGLCTEARIKIQNASNRDAFLATPVGQAYYAGSLCYSPPKDLDQNDISTALGHARSADPRLEQTHPRLRAWLQDARARCEQLERQVDRSLGLRSVAEYSGKIMGGCAHNVSGAFLQWPSGADSFGSMLKSLSWYPLVPRLSNDGKESISPTPPSKLLATARQEHMGANAAVEACPPFVVVSDTQDPRTICSFVVHFYRYFLETYEAAPPGAWLVIHHYEKQPDLDGHARRYGGPPCSGILGYYDWRRQTIAFRALPGSFGTLQHELTHALVFWDMPLAPRWFEEGLAALYENTDDHFQGLPNPWREEILKQTANPVQHFLERILGMSAIEFEADPRPATVSRAVMMRIQKRNALPQLYREIRSQVKTIDPREVAATPPDEGPPIPRVELWRRICERHLSGPRIPE